MNRVQTSQHILFVKLVHGYTVYQFYVYDISGYCLLPGCMRIHHVVFRNRAFKSPASSLKVTQYDPCRLYWSMHYAIVLKARPVKNR